MTLCIAQDPAADALLESNPFALLAGMLLDQQFPMERAFAGPALIAERMGSALDPAAVMAFDDKEFAELLAQRPAVHRYPKAMAERLQALAAHVVDNYDGDTALLWTEAADAAQIYDRLRALPGFGDQKSRIFVALLGKQFGVAPSGWREAAGDYAEAGSFRSVADVVDADSLMKVREFKKAKKAEVKAGKVNG